MAPQITGGTWSIEQGGSIVGYVWSVTVGKEYFLTQTGVAYPFDVQTTLSPTVKVFKNKGAFKAWAMDPNEGGLGTSVVENYADVASQSPWP